MNLELVVAGVYSIVALGFMWFTYRMNKKVKRIESAMICLGHTPKRTTWADPAGHCTVCLAYYSRHTTAEPSIKPGDWFGDIYTPSSLRPCRGHQ